MKIKQTLNLLTLGLASLTTVAQAQTTPTGAATSTTYPVGAVVADSGASVKPSRSQRRANKRAGSTMNSQRSGSGSTASPQDGQYRQSSSANGTAVNSSNTTNYNSNNVTNAPTGVGSNPSVAADPTTLSGSSTSGSSGSSSGSGSSMNSFTTDGAAKTGTAAAVTGARTQEPTPAVVAGSTERNTSIEDFISSSPNYVTLQNALQSSDLYKTLQENGTYTLFAPSNSAFKKLPANIQGGLLEGRNHDALKQLLSYHLVKGSLDAAGLTQQIRTGNGKAQLQTVAGGTLTARLGANGRITLTDEQGKTAIVEGADKRQSNGMVHEIDAVLMPRNGAGMFR